MVGKALLCGLALASPVYADTFYLDIGEAPLTLNEWSRQANVQILFDYTILKGVYTNPVKCECTPGEALTRLLAHLGFVYDFVNPRTVSVSRGVQVVETFRPVYPSEAEYRRWFDRYELEEPAQSYGYDLNINKGRLEEDHGNNHTDHTTAASSGLRTNGDRDQQAPSHTCRDCQALWVPLQ